MAGTPSTGVGGGVFDAKLYSCVVSGNSARQGGGVYGSTAAKGLFNCTVVGNTAWVTGTTQGGGGVYGSGTSYPVRNSIVYYNNSGGGSANLYQCSVSYSCSLPLPTGAGNIATAPMLADFVNGRLLPSSPCVGMGIYETWMADAVDLEGEARSSEESVDIGADQLFEDGLTGLLSVSIQGAAWPYYPGIAYSFEAVIDGSPTDLHWDFGDGQSTQNMAQVCHVWSEGEYTLRLTVSNATHFAEATRLLSVAPDTRYVSLTGSHEPPFLTWATAATNIQDAVDVVTKNGRVKVAGGTYACGGRAFGTEAVTNRVLITNVVEVIATDGPAATFIVGAASSAPVTSGLGNGAVRGVRLAIAGSSLVGFTVTGGRTRWSTSSTAADFLGGGVYCADGSCVVSNCVVSECAAATRGGGVYQGTILSSIIENNAACATSSNKGQGGGIYGAVLVSNCIIRANMANGGGGGVYQGLLVDSVVDGNQITGSGSGAGYYGGGIGYEVRGCTVINNSGADYGGGVYYATVCESLLTNNAAVYGGGYAMPISTTPVCPLYRCRLLKNSASLHGGGSYCGALYSCVVLGNAAGSIGGGSAYSTLENSTVVGNEASTGGGTYGGKAYYSIIYYNQASTEGTEYKSTESYGCCTTPYDFNYTSGIKTVAPQMTGLRDPHLLAGSPCIDGGDYKFWMVSTEGFDIDGESRYAGYTSDIGADERHAETATGPLTVEVTVDQTTVGLNYAPEFWADATGLVGELSWSFNDGVEITNQNPTYHAFAAPGVYQVVVTVSNATHVASATQTVTVVMGDSYASPTGGHVPPFTSWADAATNIQDAVDAAIWGGTVWLADGTYQHGGRPATGLTLTNRVCIEKPIMVRGANGPEHVLIQGAWHEPEVSVWGSAAIRGVYLGHPQARLVSVTITNGATSYVEDAGGGVYCNNDDAVGSNCVIVACQASSEGGGVFSGIWQSCVFRENVADWLGGGAAESDLIACIVSDNTALWGDGGGLSSGTALRCTFSGNSAYDDGGGSYDGWLENCLLLHNQAGYGGGATYGAMDACTIVSNSAGECGGGLYGCSALNTIVWGNQAPVDPEWTDTDFENCLTTPLPSDEYDRGGNLADDPQFVNPSSNNYRLKATSPCINMGVVDGYAAQEGATDLDGRTRLLNSAPDMGAYEYEAQAGQAALGTPIDWLEAYYDGPDWDEAELDDSDNDGFPAWMEYIVQTVPTDGESFFKVNTVSVVDGDIEIEFNTVTGRVYTIQRTTSLTSPAWVDVGDPIVGDGSPKTVPMTDSSASAFYRVCVALP